MIPVFADTAFYVAILSPRDSLHEAATRWSKENRVRVVTTEYVLLEVGNFFTRPGERESFVQLMATLAADPQTEIVASSSEIFREGYDLFAARPDKHWSLTDCTSFIVMTRHGLTEALTGDHHFTQAGFTILLKPDAGT